MERRPDPGTSRGARARCTRRRRVAVRTEVPPQRALGTFAIMGQGRQDRRALDQRAERDPDGDIWCVFLCASLNRPTAPSFRTAAVDRKTLRSAQLVGWRRAKTNHRRVESRQLDGEGGDSQSRIQRVPRLAGEFGGGRARGVDVEGWFCRSVPTADACQCRPHPGSGERGCSRVPTAPPPFLRPGRFAVDEERINVERRQHDPQRQRPPGADPAVVRATAVGDGAR
jgi:hypothetical protein